MAEPKRAKLFRNGGSQAVRLPAEFRFEGDEVLISRDQDTGNVIISDPRSISRKQYWRDFFDRLDSFKVSDEDLENYMVERPLNAVVPARILFGDEVLNFRDETTGDVTLSRTMSREEYWQDFFDRLDSYDVSGEALEEFGRVMDEIVADRQNHPVSTRKIFEDEIEQSDSEDT